MALNLQAPTESSFRNYFPVLFEHKLKEYYGLFRENASMLGQHNKLIRSGVYFEISLLFYEWVCGAYGLGQVTLSLKAMPHKYLLWPLSTHIGIM